nr:Kinesin-related protein [Ipomoea batatas]
MRTMPPSNGYLESKFPAWPSTVHVARWFHSLLSLLRLRRRLSSCFTQPSQPVRAKRQLAWVSLQGRLVGAEEASSSRAIGGGLSPEEAVAWDLFTPVQRVLVVAVIGAAASAANSKKNKRICELEKSVQLRVRFYLFLEPSFPCEFEDQVLLKMQQKLDNLCEQVNDQLEPPSNNCWLCEQHKHLPKLFPMMSMGEEVIKSEVLIPANETEPEERRMSDLSDLAPSVASSVDTQVNTVTVYQDDYSLRRDCEEKDATIKNLSACLQSSESLGSKRITELEGVIRRKNMIISKLRKDILVLEQKLIILYRKLRRPSFSKANLMKLPVLTDNIIYDMDSTTGPSSSDSDNSPRRNKPQTPAAMNLENLEVTKSAEREGDQKWGLEKNPALVRLTDRYYSSRPVSPLKEISSNQIGSSVSSSKSKPTPSGREPTSRGKPPVRSKLADQHKRWV